MGKKYYISTGELTAMYTLRCQYESVEKNEVIEGMEHFVIVDYFIKNLATDMDRAVENAKLNGFKVERPDFSLEEIKRRNSEEVAKAIKEIEEKEEIEFIARELEKIKSIARGFFPFGIYKNQKIESITKSDFNYCLYFMTLDNCDNVINALQKSISHYCPKIKKVLDIKNGNQKYFGVAKEKFKNIDATVVGYNGFDGMYGWTDIVSYALDTGELCVYMGIAGPSVEIGDSVKINFTVKAHEEYKNVKQTKILRVKIL